MEVLGNTKFNSFDLGLGSQTLPIFVSACCRKSHGSKVTTQHKTENIPYPPTRMEKMVPFEASAVVCLVSIICVFVYIRAFEKIRQ